MGEFLLQYRDPLFGLIVFFALIFIISSISYWWAIQKAKKEKKRLGRFFKRFDQKNSDIQVMLQNPSSSEALKLLADSFAKNGDYEEAIAIYTYLQKDASASERIELLKKTADLYKKAGFLERSKEIYEEILGFFPRHKDVLRSLLIVYEKLGDYDGMHDVAVALEELEGNEKEPIYVEFLKASAKGDVKKLKKLYEQGFCRRPVLEKLFFVDPKLAWKLLSDEMVLEIVDILWMFPKEQIHTHLPKLKELYSAKGYINEADRSDVFEFDLLIHYPKADLEFEYICKECKKRFPLSFSRCPSCYAVGSLEVEMLVSKKRELNEKGLSF